MLGSEHPIPLSQPTDPFLRQGITPRSTSPTRSPFLSSTDPANKPIIPCANSTKRLWFFHRRVTSFKIEWSSTRVQVTLYGIRTYIMTPTYHHTHTYMRSCRYRILECTNHPVPIPYISYVLVQVQYCINPKPSRRMPNFGLYHSVLYSVCVSVQYI